MRNDSYFDSEGNRIRLDSEFAEHCSKSYRERANQNLKEDIDKELSDYGRLACWIARWGACIFCGGFALRHIDVIWKHGSALLELLGVLFALGYIAQTLLDMWGGDGDE